MYTSGPSWMRICQSETFRIPNLTHILILRRRAQDDIFVFTIDVCVCSSLSYTTSFIAVGCFVVALATGLPNLYKATWQLPGLSLLESDSSPSNVYISPILNPV